MIRSRGAFAVLGISVVLMLIAVPSLGGSDPEQTQVSLLDAIRFTQPLSFCGEAVPLNDRQVRERLEKEMLLTLWDRPQVILWLKRCPRYLPVIETMLQEAGLPPDLRYVPIIESALRPHAGSAKGAIGFWQFTRSTGRRYGLRIGSSVDDRRSIFASTRAAVSYLRELHDQLGSWTLAAAAYNMGEHGLLAEILVQQQRDFYQLSLPLETQRYLFRILSAKLIHANPSAYGFALKPEDLYPPLSFDVVRVTCGEATPIRLLAEAAGTAFKTIKDLNPQLRGHHLVAGEHRLLVPKGAAQGFGDRFGRAIRRWQRSLADQTYVVQKGDNLSTIAERFDVPLPALLIFNRIDANQTLYPGDRLIIGKTIPGATSGSVE